MTFAPNYTPGTSFADDETNLVAGRSTVHTSDLDIEFANIESSVVGLKTNQELIQRDDGKLRDFLVEPYALSEQTRATMAANGGVPRGLWAVSAVYAVGDLVQYQGTAYMCVTAHTAGSLFTVGFWLAISGDGSAHASAVQAGTSASSALASENAAAASRIAAAASETSATASATSAQLSALSATNAAASVEALTPVSLSPYMLGLLDNLSADETIDYMGVVTETGLLSSSSGDLGAGLVGYKASLSYPASTVGRKLREVISPADYTTTALALAAAKTAGVALRFNTNTTINIPTDGTLQDVFDHCIAGRNGVVITARIAAGHQLVAGALVKDGDYSCFKITSADATVIVSPSWPANTCVLEGRRARMPIWSILLNCNGIAVGGNDGYNLGALAARENSDLFIEPTFGVTNNGSATCANLITAQSSRVTSNQGVFTGAAFRNVWVTHASGGYMERCNISGAGGANVFVSRESGFYGTGGNYSDSGEEGVLVYRSIFMAVPFGSVVPTFNNNGTYAVLAQQASRVIVRERDGYKPVISNGAGGIRLDGASRGDINNCTFTTLTGPAINLVGASIAQARGGTYTGIGTVCLAVDNGSTLDAADSIFNGVVALLQANGGYINVNNSDSNGALTGTAIYALNGGTVVAVGADFRNAGIHGISCEHASVYAENINLSGADGHGVRAVGGFVDVTGATCTGAGLNGISAVHGSRIIASSANFVSANGTNGISAQSGSHIAANSCNAQKGVSPGSSDVSISTGSTIAFNGGTGGLSTPANTSTGAGIIYQ